MQTQVTDPSVEVSGPSGTITQFGAAHADVVGGGSVRLREQVRQLHRPRSTWAYPWSTSWPRSAESSPATCPVQSSDGYEQDYAYDNVHPTPQWAELQGIMVLAVEKDGITMPAGATARESCSSRPTAAPQHRLRGHVRSRAGVERINPQGDGPACQQDPLCHQETRRFEK